MRLTIFDYSKSEYEPDSGFIESAGFSYSQADVIKRIFSLLNLPKEEFGCIIKGCCKGLSEVWLLSHMITDLSLGKSEVSHPICDSKWFWNMMNKLMVPAESLDEKDMSEIRNFVEQIIFQQFYYQKVLDSSESDFNLYSEIVNAEGKLVPIYKNFQICCQLTEDQLIDCLEQLDEKGLLEDQYITLTFVVAFNGLHMIGLLKKGAKWMLYDPNLKKGEMAYDNPRAVIGKIYAVYDKSSLAFRITSYGTERKTMGKLKIRINPLEKIRRTVENDSFFLFRHSDKKIHDKMFEDKESLKDYLFYCDYEGKKGFHIFIDLYPHLISSLIEEFSNPIDVVVLGELLADSDIEGQTGAYMLMSKASEYLEHFLDVIDHVEHKHRILGDAFLAVNKKTATTALDLLFKESISEDLRNRVLGMLCDEKCPLKDYVRSYIEIKKEYPKYRVACY